MRLTPRQKLFAERTRLYHTYPYHVDAYLSVYNCSGSRRTATANASRIFNKPSVQEYIKRLRQEGYRLQAETAENEHQRFIAQLLAGDRKSRNNTA